MNFGWIGGSGFGTLGVIGGGIVPDPPEIIPNSTFDENIDGWNALAPATATWNSELQAINLARNSSGAVDAAETTVSLVAGVVYLVKINVISMSHGAGVRIAGTGITGAVVGANTWEHTAATTGDFAFRLLLLNSVVATAVVDNVSVKRKVVEVLPLQWSGENVQWSGVDLSYG